jgi:hypothetical protein
VLNGPWWTSIDTGTADMLELGIREVLEWMRPSDRAILELRLQQYSVEEICAKTGRALRTVERSLQKVVSSSRINYSTKTMTSHRPSACFFFKAHRSQAFGRRIPEDTASQTSRMNIPGCQGPQQTQRPALPIPIAIRDRRESSRGGFQESD